MKWLLVFIAISCSLPNYRKDKAKTSHLDNKPIIILISIDGYRHDYTKIYNPAHLSQVAREGVSAELKPCLLYTSPSPRD